MSIFYALTAFNAGELSPKMAMRTDVAQYNKGCQTLRNFLVTPYGSVERRPGTKFIAETKTATGAVRIVRFVFSSSVAYICEFGVGYIRFFYNDAPVYDAQGNIVEIATSYTASELRELQFVQSADVMTIVHGNHPVMELKRTSVNTFTFSVKDYKYPPMLDPNLDDDCSITASNVSGDITLQATKDVWESTNVGGYYQLIHTREENEVEKDFTADGVSDTLEVYGYWTFTTHGTWTGVVKLQKSFDNGATWNDFRSYTSANDANVSTSGTEEEEDVLYRVKMEDYEQSSSGTLKLCRIALINPDFVTTGVVKITRFVDARNVYATVIRKLGNYTATSEWNEGAWSDRRGYPCSVAFFEERIFFGGTWHQGQRVWGSATNAWDDFLTGDKDDRALDFTLASDTVNTICWMCQHAALVIGTLDSEWTLSSSDQGALTPSNFKVRRQSVYGSAGIVASMVGEVILFVQRQSRKVREFVYEIQKDGYTSPDMTVLADHITESGIVETALQQLPDSIFWCVLGDGTLAALTYEREQEVVGWHKHTTNGKFLSIAIIPAGSEDRIYFVVERDNKRYIEVMQSRNFETISDAWFLDCATSAASASGVSVVTDLARFNGGTVAILADGAELPGVVVSGGTVSLDDPAKKVVVGLPYESNLTTMSVELETQSGQTLCRSKIVGETRVRVYNSVGGEVQVTGDVWQSFVSRDVNSDYVDTAVSPKSEVLKVVSAGGYHDGISVSVRQRAPLPMNVMGIVVKYDVAE